MNQIDGVISIKDLFAELVRKCWLIIICAFVFAVALGGYKLVGNLQAGKNADEEIKELTEEQIEVIQDYVAKAKELESLELFYENSILLKINPYNVYRTELQYLITGEVEEEILPTIRAAYADYVLFGRLASDIEEAYGDYEELALKDIMDTDPYIREQEKSLRTVRIMILAKDEEQTEELVECVKEQIAAYSEEINETIAPHGYELIDENTFHYFKSDLVGSRDNYILRIADLEEQVDVLEGQLNSIQMTYALELLGEEVGNVEEESNPQGIGLKSILKFAIFGGVLGCGIAVILIVALYFFTNQVKSEKETEYAYEIPHLGNCCTYEGNAFDKLADKIFYKNKTRDIKTSIEEIVENVVGICKENKITEIAFVGAIDEKTGKTITEITKKLQKYNIVASVHEANALDKNILPQNIVHVEVVRKTTGEDVSRDVLFCKEQGLEIRGYITFSK